MSGTLYISGTMTGTNGNKDISGSITSTTASLVVTETVLAAGANTITVPSNSTGCVIKLPSTNTSVTTLKGVAGDTGIAIGKTGTIVLSWEGGTAPASFVLDSVSTQTGLYTQVSFF